MEAARQGNGTHWPDLSHFAADIAGLMRRSGNGNEQNPADILARVDRDGQPQGALTQNWPSPLPALDRLPSTSELCLRRRKQRVIVRSPGASETPLRTAPQERRAHLPTLSGLGTREQLPTLVDAESPLPPTVRPRVHAIVDLDADATEQLLLEAERLSLCFEWDKD